MQSYEQMKLGICLDYGVADAQQLRDPRLQDHLIVWW
jgi:hypothetical protein